MAINNFDGNWAALQHDRVEEKSSSGKKVRIAKKVKRFSSQIFPSELFLAHVDLGVLQKWQTTHFKACSKWWRNDKIARFNWIWQRKLVLKCNATTLQIIINLPNIQEWAVSGPVMCYYNLVKLIDNFIIWLEYDSPKI